MPSSLVAWLASLRAPAPPTVAVGQHLLSRFSVPRRRQVETAGREQRLAGLIAIHPTLARRAVPQMTYLIGPGWFAGGRKLRLPYLSRFLHRMSVGPVRAMSAHAVDPTCHYSRGRPCRMQSQFVRDAPCRSALADAIPRGEKADQVAAAIAAVAVEVLPSSCFDVDAQASARLAAQTADTELTTVHPSLGKPARQQIRSAGKGGTRDGGEVHMRRGTVQRVYAAPLALRSVQAIWPRTTSCRGEMVQRAARVSRKPRSHSVTRSMHARHSRRVPCQSCSCPACDARGVLARETSRAGPTTSAQLSLCCSKSRTAAHAAASRSPGTGEASSANILTSRLQTAAVATGCAFTVELRALIPGHHQGA